MVSRRALLRAVPAAFAPLSGCRFLGDDGTPSPSGLQVRWTSGPSLNRRRTQTTAVTLDGRLYVIGGIVDAGDRALAVFDGSVWHDATPPPKAVNHTSAVALDGRIHVLGGYSGSFLGSPPLDAHWTYDPPADAWDRAPSLPTPRGALVAVVADGRIHAIGGATAEGTTAVVEVYDPKTGSWSKAARMPTAREHLSAGAVDGDVYVAGGRVGLGPMVDATERYLPGADRWEERAPMPTARAGIAGAVLDGRLFVFGGEEVGEQVFGDVAAYHPPTDTWTRVQPLPTPRWGLGAAATDGRIHTVCGGAVPSAQETRVLETMSTV